MADKKKEIISDADWNETQKNSASSITYDIPSEDGRLFCVCEHSMEYGAPVLVGKDGRRLPLTDLQKMALNPEEALKARNKKKGKTKAKS